jgi:aminoglycoside phosphotransferase (APT) family kinase protein
MDAELSWITSITGASRARRGDRIQSLWSGYGELFRVHLTGADRETAIVKWVKPPARARTSPRDASHARKCRSYDVELAWYRKFAPLCDDPCRVPQLLGSRAADGEWMFLLEDLDAAGFAERRRDPSGAALDACLAWLAALHARFLGVPPDRLWKTGTYWHLATRPDELAAIDDDALRAAAPILDRKLRSCVFQTIVHGDAKPDNFCFTRRGTAVAAVDFQYVGGGCGMKDVAYLLSGGSTADAHLETYFVHLRAAAARRVDPLPRDALDALETEWRALYPIACADYYRFLAGWAKDHWRRDREGQRLVSRVLATLSPA